MRIFVASGIFHPDSGGPATYLYRFLPELQARGHEVRVLTYSNQAGGDYPYPVTRIPFDRLPIRLLKYARTYRVGAAWADLIYIHSFDLPRSGDGGKPRVMKIVGDRAWERSLNTGWIPPDEGLERFQAHRYGPVIEWFKASRRREAQQMHRIIVPCGYLKDLVAVWGVDSEKIDVVYNALDTDHYVPPQSRAQARIDLGWDPAGHYLITAGRLIALKGIDYLIDAVRLVPEIRLIVAGDGPMRDSLKAQVVAAQVADRVQFLGKVPHERMALYLRAADYLALYSNHEGLSHTILEALYAGTPVIASARGGNPEVVHDGVNGLLVPYGDRDRLAAAIRQAFDGDMPQRLAAGTSSGLERFAWPRLVEQTVRILNETALQRKSRTGAERESTT